MTEESITITISGEENVAWIRSRMATGEYASENDLIHDCLEALKDEYEERRRYEQEVVGPAHDELMADLSSAIPIEQVERELAAARLQRLKAS